MFEAFGDRFQLLQKSIAEEKIVLIPRFVSIRSIAFGLVLLPFVQAMRSFRFRIVFGEFQRQLQIVTSVLRENFRPLLLAALGRFHHGSRFCHGGYNCRHSVDVPPEIDLLLAIYFSYAEVSKNIFSANVQSHFHYFN